MLGAMLGDIVGSRYEFHNIKTKDFPLFHPSCFPTDDSIMTLAVAKAILCASGDGTDLGEQTVRWMRALGQPHPDCGYGGRFHQWMYDETMGPYHSFGNGAAMRVSPCGFAAGRLEEAISLARAVTQVTHDHPEGLKGAEATAVAIYLARTGESKEAIRAHISARYYPLDFTLDGIRADYQFNETCQETVPQAIEAFLESSSFEDAIRNAISLGGDSDTLAAITGGIAQAYYGVPQDLRAAALSYLDQEHQAILLAFEEKFPAEENG
jgi:type I restriction enzyme M protein